MMKKSAALKKVVRETKVEASPKRAVSRRIGVSKASRRRPDDADAFLRVRQGTSFTKDDLAEELAEGFVGSATSGEGQGIDTRDAVVDEETGGPFVTTPAKREFAEGTDLSNPEDADREPFPTSQSDPFLDFEPEPEP
jgi:hypothetical protein